jgi:hypothetical protein
MENTNQRELLNTLLKKIKEDVTPKDRKQLSKKFGYTPATISIYLNGKGLNNDTALIIYQLLRTQISKRNKIIENV